MATLLVSLLVLNLVQIEKKNLHNTLTELQELPLGILFVICKKRHGLRLCYVVLVITFFLTTKFVFINRAEEQCQVQGKLCNI